MMLTRREVLRIMGMIGAVALQPAAVSSQVARTTASTSPSYGFLSTDELAILDAAAEVLLPTDGVFPGAREIGIVDYIQSLLSFMPGSDANCDMQVTAADLTAVRRAAREPEAACANGSDVNGDDLADDADADAAAAAVFRARPMFAAGPFSGRNPQPHFPVGSVPCAACHEAVGISRSGQYGSASAGTVDVYPPPAFRLFLPMNRLQRLSWKIRILGSDSVPEVANNPVLAQLPDVDLRRRYRAGLASIDSGCMQRFGKRFVEASPAQQAAVLERADPRFYLLLVRHVIEGTFCAPEYGGNRDRLGWKLTGFDGDSQPLGYEIYDESVPGCYRERPDKPNSGPNPDEDCHGFSARMRFFLEFLSSTSEGRAFRHPYCFEVES